MNRNRNNTKDERYKKDYKGKSRSKSRNNGGKRDRKKDESGVPTTSVESPLVTVNHKNLGTWYYTNAEVMEQASRLSFQTVLGLSSSKLTDSAKNEFPTTEIIYFNPCPGVTPTSDNTAPYSHTYNNEGVNLAGFKLFTQLSMRSGRTSTYAPQDIITLLLQLGELISQVEWGRRFFGIAFTYNQRNRVWPKDIISMLGIDAQDFFSNLANYRMRMNTAITRIKQIPIPSEVGYLKKCEYLYQSAYTDSTSPLAQIYIFNPFSTWIMDETGSTGTILRTKYMQEAWDITKSVPHNQDTLFYNGPRTFGDWLDKVLEPMIDALLQSSTLNVIYADILNYAASANMPFWQWDYISEAYAVTPEFNPTMLEIIHNLGAVGAVPEAPEGTFAVDGNSGDTTNVFTPENNVYHDPKHNAIIYNPLFTPDRLMTGMLDITNDARKTVLVDLNDPNADIDTRLDVMEYKAVLNNSWLDTDQGTGIQLILPDHYVTHATIFSQVADGNNNSLTLFGWWLAIAQARMNGSLIWVDQFAAHPMRYSIGLNSSNHMIIPYVGYGTDLNYWTVVDADYMARLLKLSYLGLFEIRV